MSRSEAKRRSSRRSGEGRPAARRWPLPRAATKILDADHAGPRPTCPPRLLAVTPKCFCWCYAFTLTIAATSIGCSSGKDPGGGPPGAQQQGPPEVTVAKPLVTQTLDWDEYTGRLAPIEDVDVRARVSGYLQSHHFEEGQKVKKGQLLYVIDERPYQADVAQAEATLEESIAMKRQAEAEVGAAEARKQQAEAQLELTIAQLNRAKPLVPSGAVSEDEYDELFSAAKQAEADGFAADAQIESAKASLSGAEAAIVVAEAALSSAKLELSYCRIEAPIAGRIGRRQVTEGNLISGGGSSGGSLLTSIVSIAPIHANFDAGEQALLKYIRLDREHKRASSRDVKTPVWMKLSDEEGYPHKGYIDFVDNRVDAASGSIRARAIFPNEDQSLIPGVFVKLQLPASAAEERVLLPDSAIASDQNAKIVYVVDEENKLTVQPIETGPTAKGMRVIEKGLTGNETVVVRGLQRCKPDIEVKTTVEELKPDNSSLLPDTYEPVPPEEWLQPVASSLPTTDQGVAR